MAEHTPGPWHYRPHKDDDWGTVRASRTEDDIHEGYPSRLVAQARSGRFDKDEELNEHRRNKTDPYEANARLIAAAPELLDALKEMVDGLEWFWRAHRLPEPCEESVIGKARDAIAKATRRKP